MTKEQIRVAIVIELRGKAYVQSYKLKRALEETLGVDANKIHDQIFQMAELGHVVQLNPHEIRLSVEGERFYFSTRREKIVEFLKKNWPYVTSNLIALAALIISIFWG